MSTSGGFTPPADPPCPYQPRMTRAQALALRAAGSLRENCVVVVTDGPTIGTAGNTSPTEIELNPVGPSDLGATARVHTTFAPSAWNGVYDIDSGAAGTITELRDDFGNTAKDTDAGGATVHTQFPWHLGSSTMRDNYVEDSTLTGWATQVGPVTNNRVRASTVDFTGKTGGTVDQNVIDGSTITAGPSVFTMTAAEVNASTIVNAAAAMTITRGDFSASSFSNLGSGATTFTDCQFNGSTNAVVLQATDTQGATFFRAQFLGGYRVNLNRTGGGAFTIAGSVLRGASSDPLADMVVSGTGSHTVSNSEIIARGGGGSNHQFTIDGDGTFQVIQARIVGSLAVNAPGGIVRAPGATGNLQLVSCEIIEGFIRVNSTGGLLVNDGSRVYSGSIVHDGAALLTISGTTSTRSTFTMGAGSTRALVVGNTLAEGSTVTQNGTGSANTDAIINVSNIGVILQRAAVTFASTLAGTPTQTYQGLDMRSGATLTSVDPLTANPLNNVSLDTQAVLNLQPGGLAARCRLSCEAVLNTGPFQNLGSIIEGQFAKTSTGDNVNRLCNKSFDDWI